jgi:hypothetical protein
MSPCEPGRLITVADVIAAAAQTRLHISEKWNRCSAVGDGHGISA